jgi:hypothetical protein
MCLLGWIGDPWLRFVVGVVVAAVMIDGLEELSF